jgi:hypothetical protein
MTALKASVARAYSHHAVVRERAELVRLLLDEREHLKARVEAATADLRQTAAAREVTNTRLRALLRLTQLSAQYESEETLIRMVFEELSNCLPLRTLVLCDVTRQKLVAVMQSEEGDVSYVSAETERDQAGYDSLLAEAEPKLLVQTWLERHTGLDTSGMVGLVFPQAFWNRSMCTVGFYLSSDFVGDEAEREFLGMCAHFVAFEYEQAKLLLHVAHQASLGNIAVEVARNFIQPLTAIQTTADLIEETALSPDVIEGVKVIHSSVERLRRQTQEFRKLAWFREDSVQTVRLDEYIKQALDVLSVAIQSRGVQIREEFITDCECVLLNGTALARTFLDLILGALRNVEVGGGIALRLTSPSADHVAFEIAHNGLAPGGVTVEPAGGEGSGAGQPNPGLQLAERTVHSCGGALSVEQDVERGETRLRILLPRNATDPNVLTELKR